MDSNAAAFKGVTAQMTRIEYTAVLKEKTEEKAVLTMWKGKKGPAVLLDFKSPDVKDILIRDGQFSEFFPKLNLIRETDLGKYSSAVNQFVTLGFGASGKDLQKNYKIDYKGPEVLKIADKDVKVTKLELTPKSAEALEYMKKLEFWIPEGSSYTIQMKIHQPSGDTNTAIYTDVQVNPVGLNEHSVELKTPKNVAHEKINK
jgi:hypothetical protein